MQNNNILIIAATDLSDNNSASLCHNAYIRGFVDADYNVEVLTVKPVSRVVKFEIQSVVYHFFSDENFLIKYVRKKRRRYKEDICIMNPTKSSKDSLALLIKKKIISYFGATRTWMRRIKRFSTSDVYDYIISLSSPPTSHEAAWMLISKKNIIGNRWCQLWEDPWSTDLYCTDETVKIKEEKILDTAERILYVSPLTLRRQKELFPLNANKMDWLPLPTYFEGGMDAPLEKKNIFGYFGQYYPQVRNIRPVYESIDNMGLDFIICGEPHTLFKETSKINIFPRLSPEDLKKYEDKTDILVFVANLGGGQIPGKIYQYSGTNKKILFVLDGNNEEKDILKNYFGKFNRYYFAENTVESISSTIDIIINDDRISDVKNQPVEYFRAKNIANEIIRMIS